MRPVFLVPDTKKIAELLKELQAQRTPFAVVIDEYGGTAGIVSIEDIVEELVGEIKDEYDVETEPITVEADGSVLVAGQGQPRPARAGPRDAPRATAPRSAPSAGS